MGQTQEHLTALGAIPCCRASTALRADECEANSIKHFLPEGARMTRHTFWMLGNSFRKRSSVIFGYVKGTSTNTTRDPVGGTSFPASNLS